MAETRLPAGLAQGDQTSCDRARTEVRSCGRPAGRLWTGHEYRGRALSTRYLWPDFRLFYFCSVNAIKSALCDEHSVFRVILV